MEHLLIPKSWNRHHLWWNKADYRKGLHREFRGFPGNIVPAPIEQHNALHRDLDPPLIPSRRQMLNAMDILASHPEHTEYTWGAVALRAYFQDEAFTLASCEQAEKALHISEHLGLQIGYLVLQKVG